MTAASQNTSRQSIEYPDSDGQPIGEDTLHFDWIIRIAQWLESHYSYEPNVFVAGDLLWYPVEGEPTIRTAPDALVAFGRPKGHRGSYKQWMEGNIAPQVVFEVLPTRDRFRETLRKWQFYQQYGVEELYIYKPDTGHFEGWLRKAGQLEEIPEIAGFVSPRLQIRFEPGEESDELKFFGRGGNRFLTFCENVEQRKAAEALARAERERGDRYAAKLRELGVDPDPSMKLGYNTNGLAHHRLVDAIELLADLGYQSVAITLDAGALDPYDDPQTLQQQIAQVRSTLDRRGLSRVIETGARYLLNPRLKHDPTLMDPDPARRAVRSEFLHRAIDIAEALGAHAVSLWSGRASLSTVEGVGLDRLAEGLRPLLAHAERVHVPLAFEPEPGMFIDTLEQFGRLDERIDHPLFQLTVDLGHVHCLEEGDIPALIRAWGHRIVNVHIEDMVRGVHEHLMFGEGTMDFPPICRALGEIGYRGGVHVELSRHSHAGVEAAQVAAASLMPLLSRPVPRRP